MLDRPRKIRRARHFKQQTDARGKSGRAKFCLRMLLPLLLVVIVVTCWLVRGFALWPLVLANESLTNRASESALEWLHLAERLHGDPASIALLRARVNRRLGDLRAMDEELDRALKFGAEPDRVNQERLLATAQIGRLHEVEEALRKWLEDPGEDGADLCDAYTNGLASQGRLTQTTLLLDAWEAGFPTDPKPHVKRGRIAEHALEYEHAEAEYRAALKKNPDYSAALYALGRLLLDRKRPAEALPLLRRCASVAPGASPAARVGEASCLRLLGNVVEARRLLEHVVALDEKAQRKAYVQVGFQANGAPAALELGRLETGDRNYESAEKWLRHAVTADPHDLDARYAWAVALRGIGRTEEAKSEFEHVSRVRKLLAETEVWQTHLVTNPDDVETRYKVAMVYLQHHSPRLGIYWLQSVLAHDPKHQPSHRALAEYYEMHTGEVPSYASLAKYHRSQLPQDMAN